MSGTSFATVSGATFYSLKVENHQAQPLTLTVLTIDQPNMTGRRYSVNGEVKYEGVEGMGYLETVEVLSRRWAVFHPDAGRAGPDDEAHRHIDVAAVRFAVRLDR